MDKLSKESMEYLIREENLIHTLKILRVSQEIMTLVLTQFWRDLNDFLMQSMPAELKRKKYKFLPLDDEGTKNWDDEYFAMTNRYARIDLLEGGTYPDNQILAFSIEQSRLEAPTDKRADKLFQQPYSLYFGLHWYEEASQKKEYQIEEVKELSMTLGTRGSKWWMVHYDLDTTVEHSAIFLGRNYALKDKRLTFFKEASNRFWTFVEDYHEKVDEINRVLKTGI